MLVTDIRARTARRVSPLRGRAPIEKVMGFTPEIAPWIIFEWFDMVYYLDNDSDTKLAYWMGPAEGQGGGNCHWLLPVSGLPIVRSTVFAIPEEDLATEEKRTQQHDFRTAIMDRIGDNADDGDDLLPEFPAYGDLFDEVDVQYEPEAPRPDVDDTEEGFSAETFDQYLQAEVMLPRGGEAHRGTVQRRVKDGDGLPVGRANQNPLLDTREYEVVFPDGATEAYTANLIAENIYSQVDDDGRQFAILSEIVDHRSDRTALKKAEGYSETKSGNLVPKRTTRGWEILCEWKDQSTDWIRLADLKDSYPIELAEYAKSNGIADEPAFAWWVPHVLRKKDRILAKVKTKYWKRTHKYGIRLPKSVKEALEIDRATGTDYWRKAIDKEMKNVRVAFEAMEDGKPPVGHKEIGCHMVFDVKISLTRKARMVADGHKVEVESKDNTFSSVVSRDSVRIFFMLAALNDLPVLSSDIQNAYLTAPIKEKYWYKAGLEFGSDVGKPMKVVRALYGLPTAGATFRAYLAGTLRSLGYQSCQADPDVWMRKAVKPDGTKYWEYLLAYVDDLIGCSHDVKRMFDQISATFKFKEDAAEPTLYLGADISKWTIYDADDVGKDRWAMSSSNYTKKAITEVERELKQVGKFLPTKAPTPMSGGYRPELDMTDELDATRQNYYQGVIGVLRWLCELGRLDILVSVSMLSRYLAQAREGHLEQAFHIFAYLKAHDRSTLVFDDTCPYIDQRRFNKRDWSEFYPGAAEIISPKMPEARGLAVTMSCFVDADHAGCRDTRRSHTGVIVFVNRAPILWYSKRQTTVETSTWGSEICALRTAIEMVEGLRYKLRMMGVELDGPADIFCDNDSVVKSTTRPESNLQKKSNAVAYHKARESQAAGAVRITHEDGDTNLADILTKLLAGPRLKELISKILW
jgi:hypothetical protein